MTTRGLAIESSLISREAIELHESSIVEKEKALHCLFTHFSLVPKEEGRERLISYLSGDDSILLTQSPQGVREGGVEQGLRDSLQEYISASFLPPRFEEEGQRSCWIERCLRGILEARERIALGQLIGTEDRFVNALVGPVLQGISASSFSQEAALRTPDRGGRVVRWRNVGDSFDKVRCSPKMRSARRLLVSTRQEPPMGIAGFSIQTSVAHAIGDRLTQEDGDLCGKVSICDQEVGYFAIIDGHAGLAMTAFLQQYFSSILSNHFAIARKPFKEMDVGEIENVLTSLFVKIQTFWHVIGQEWKREHFVDEMETMIKSIFDNVGQIYREDLQVPVALKWIQSKMHDKLLAIDKHLCNEEKKQKAYEGLKEVVGDFYQELLSQDFQKELFGKELGSGMIIDKVVFDVQRNVRKACAKRSDDPGAVVSLAVIGEDMRGPALYAVNVGDSRILALQDGHIYPMTDDATPSDERFAKGVVKRGGSIVSVDGGPRVRGLGGLLNVTRALGDLTLPGLTARAKVQRKLLDRPTSVIIGCDGLFESLSSQAVGKMYQRIEREPTIRPAEHLVRCAYSSGSSDNLSAMVLDIQPQ